MDPLPNLAQSSLIDREIGCIILSDVFYWVLLISYQLDIDLGTALRRKLSKNAAKYPIDKAFGRKKKYNELT